MVSDRVRLGAAVSLLVLDRSSLPVDIAEKLGREVIHIQWVEPDVLSSPAGTGPDTPVVIAWLPGGLSLSTTSAYALVRWRNCGELPTGLIGCAPRGNTADAEIALAAGFDDVMVGPISIRELAGRIRALMRRLQPAPRPTKLRLGYSDLSLDRASHSLWYRGRRILLTRTEFDVMAALVSAAGQPRSRVEILDSVRDGVDSDVGERAVDNVILRLRRKLGNGHVIETVRGVGFRLSDGDVGAASAEPGERSWPAEDLRRDS